MMSSANILYPYRKFVVPVYHYPFTNLRVANGRTWQGKTKQGVNLLLSLE